MSYTTFRIGEPELSSVTFTPGDELVVTVPVTNSGGRDGTEVVQCYVEPPAGELFRPVKELKAFGKIRVDPGQTGIVTLVLSDRSFACWDPGSGETSRVRSRLPLGNMGKPSKGDRPPGWRIDPGRYVLHVGRSSADIAWTVPVTVPEAT